MCRHEVRKSHTEKAVFRTKPDLSNQNQTLRLATGHAPLEVEISMRDRAAHFFRRADIYIPRQVLRPGPRHKSIQKEATSSRQSVDLAQYKLRPAWRGAPKPGNCTRRSPGSLRLRVARHNSRSRSFTFSF